MRPERRNGALKRPQAQKSGATNARKHPRWRRRPASRLNPSGYAMVLPRDGRNPDQGQARHRTVWHWLLNWAITQIQRSGLYAQPPFARTPHKFVTQDGASGKANRTQQRVVKGQTIVGRSSSADQFAICQQLVKEFWGLHSCPPVRCLMDALRCCQRDRASCSTLVGLPLDRLDGGGFAGRCDSIHCSTSCSHQHKVSVASTPS